MPSLTPLSHLLAQMQNISVTETGARQLEPLVQEALLQLEPLTKAQDSLLAIRARASQRGLETEVLAAFPQYWREGDKVSRMSKLTQIRAQACLLVQQVLAMSKK